jgi:hypothetical protein
MRYKIIVVMKKPPVMSAYPLTMKSLSNSFPCKNAIIAARKRARQEMTQ